MTGEPVDGPMRGGRPGPGTAPGPGGLRERADELRERRTPFVEATVVRAVRPTSAKAGDRALVLPDGTIEGFVGGTCAESSVRLQGLRVLRAGEAVVLRIVPEAPPQEPEEAAGPAAEGLVTVHNPCASGGMLEIFLEGVFPPPLVGVWGDAPVARALRSVGEALGYDIHLAGPGQPLPPDTAAVVVASHGRDEEEVLAGALRAGVPYVGLIASRRRGAQVISSLDVPTWDRERVHTPAGLDIGARTAPEVALSVFAQIVSERLRGHTAAPSAGAALAGPGAPGTGTTRQAPPEAGVSPAGPAEPAPAGPAPAGTAPAGAVPAGTAAPEEAVDPVCGMTVAVAQATLNLSHDGRMWYFCGPGCRQAFADDPARYAG